MFDEELGSSRLKMRIGGERGQSLDERVVGCRWIGVRGGDSVVEGGEDTWRAFLFDEIADNLPSASNP